MADIVIVCVDLHDRTGRLENQARPFLVWELLHDRTGRLES